MEEVISDVTLMLLSLTSWTEGKEPFNARRSWKGCPFDVLNKLEEQGFITGSRRAKSVWLTDKGEKKARALLERYGLKAAGIS